ncbi:MAG: CocE/NonD family hydrolase [Actinomycetota bacterium]
MKNRAIIGALVAFMCIASTGTLVANAATVEQRGYIPMSDGTLLKYTVNLPDASGKFPVALVYDPYQAGDGLGNKTAAGALLAHGYAVLSVAIRGTGCSGGTFDLLGSHEGSDGAAVVEWAASQSWSNAHVGMFGASYPGISQLEVASARPLHLDAISPFHVLADAYRDVAYPGGIFNIGFASLWSLFAQPETSYSSAQTAAQQQDPICMRNIAQHAAAEPTGNTFPRAQQHPFDDEYWAVRRPGADAAKIDVPVFGCVSWQDDSVSSREGDSWFDQLDPTRTWIVGTNGYHGTCSDSLSGILLDQLVSYFDRFVKGVDNGFEQTPHVQLWHETTQTSSLSTPRWISTFSSWANIPVEPSRLYFDSNGVLSSHRPVEAHASDSYLYPISSASNEDGVVGETNALWKAPVPPEGSLSYTTPSLTNDAEFFGPGSVDLWLSSTAPDTDLQITLTEVRPDGQELYVARGWLRASHRKLDSSRSTELLPYQTHQQSDAESLRLEKPTFMRVELFPFNHVFRTGSSIRLWIDAPTSDTGNWALDFIKTPAINSILHDAKHPSSLVLGYLPDGTAQGTALPACDTLLNQPCRTNTTPVPPGTLTITPEDS